MSTQRTNAWGIPASAEADDGVYFFGAPGTFPPLRAAGAPAASLDPLGHEGEIVIENACGYVEPDPVPAAAAAALRRPPTKMLCSFFLEGRCVHGERCRFRHLLPNPEAIAAFEALLQDIMKADEATVASGGAGSVAGSATTAGAAEDAAFQEASRRWQDTGAAPASGGAADAGDAMNDAASLAYAAIAAALVASGTVADEDEADAALQIAERRVSSEATCSICLEAVTESAGRKFGLLTSCSHCFCLPCIREWRGNISLPASTTRACPVCRTVSFYVIPSDRFISSPARKRQVNAEYLATQKSIACMHWNYGRGNCAFGSSCFYKHLNPDGSEATAPRDRARWDAEGRCEAVKGADLSDFLSLARGLIARR